MPETSEPAADARRQILIVEDEVLIRIATAVALRDAGYQVIEASGADEALEYLAANPRIDLVFSDINMPGSTDGLNLARQIKRKYPAIKVILTSGRLRPGRRVPFLPKPYTAKDALALIAATLANDA